MKYNKLHNKSINFYEVPFPITILSKFYNLSFYTALLICHGYLFKLHKDIFRNSIGASYYGGKYVIMGTLEHHYRKAHTAYVLSLLNMKAPGTYIKCFL